MARLIIAALAAAAIALTAMQAATPTPQHVAGGHYPPVENITIG